MCMCVLGALRWLAKSYWPLGGSSRDVSRRLMIGAVRSLSCLVGEVLEEYVSWRLKIGQSNFFVFELLWLSVAVEGPRGMYPGG